ncbi:22092_t:CDS:10, partial [Cetraspora pellucida]
MDKEFEKTAEKHVMWPQQINPEIAKDALAEFYNNINLNKLHELPCTVCSGLYNYKSYKIISVNEINLFLLRLSHDLIEPSFEINFNYEHPYINTNNMWFEPMPLCLQELTIPEQLLISPGYLYMNLIQLTKRKYTYHKLKGYIITLPQNPSLLLNISPLPIYQLSKYLKVLQVWKSKISTTLNWLFSHNKLFKDKFRIDKNALNLLPEEHYTGYAQEAYQQSDSETDDKDDSEHNLNNFINNASELRPSGILHINDVPVTKKVLTLLSFQKLVEKSNQHSSNQQSSNESTPSLFIMINPADLHSPIVMMYAENEIDIEKLTFENFLKASESAQLTHLNPSAIAKYFNITIHSIINTLIGYNKENGGVLGFIKNYYGVVEYQDHVGQSEITSPQVLAYLLGIPDHYIPNKFASIHLQFLEFYFTKECKKQYQTFTKVFDESDDDFNDDLDTDNIQNAQNLLNESFLVTFYNNKLTAINFHNKTYIQIHRKQGTKKIVVLCGKGIPKKDDVENAELYGLNILMLFKLWKTVQDLYSFTLSSHIRYIISNIELLHRCVEETFLDCELRKKDLTDLFDDNDNKQDIVNASNNMVTFSPAAIIRSGLKDVRTPTSKYRLSQLLLYLASASGTGKSRVIHAICLYFENILQCHTLLILAPTGIAAANVYDSTIHSACKFGFGENSKKLSALTEESLQQLQELWSEIEYVIINEISKIGQNLLTQFHTFMKKLKVTDDLVPFARINIMFVSDFMQLPLVLDSDLYMPDKITCLSSCNPQTTMSTTTSSIQDSSKSKKRKPDCRNAIFLITRNDLYVQLNFDATREHDYYNNQPLIYSCAYNTRCGILPLSINIKVVITINICANDNLANGLQGILQKIVYDKDSIDPLPCDKNKVILKSPPKYVIVKLIDRAPGSYQDLQPNHVPIYPVKHACVQTIWKCDGSKIQRRFQQFQLLLTLAFVFTDYKCQERTLHKVIVNLIGSNTSNDIWISPALCAEFNKLDKCIQRTNQLKE